MMLNVTLTLTPKGVGGENSWKVCESEPLLLTPSKNSACTSLKSTSIKTVAALATAAASSLIACAGSLRRFPTLETMPCAAERRSASGVVVVELITMLPEVSQVTHVMLPAVLSMM